MEETQEPPFVEDYSFVAESLDSAYALDSPVAGDIVEDEDSYYRNSRD